MAPTSRFYNQMELLSLYNLFAATPALPLRSINVALY